RSSEIGRGNQRRVIFGDQSQEVFFIGTSVKTASEKQRRQAPLHGHFTEALQKGCLADTRRTLDQKDFAAWVFEHIEKQALLPDAIDERLRRKGGPSSRAI